MMFRLSLLVALIAATTAKVLDVNKDIPADSKLGNALLSQARQLNNKNNEQDFTWMAGYVLKFDSCHTIDYFFQSDEENGGNNQDQGFKTVGKQSLVKFSLCHKDDCTKCQNGGQYLVPINTFVQAYAAFIADACERVEQTCNCYNNYYNDSCLSKCYKEAGLKHCNDDNFDIEEKGMCQEAEYGNNYYTKYWEGPYCSPDGTGIYLGVFTDAGCSNLANDGIYEKYNYGVSLPYSYDSLVDSSKCHQCVQVENNQNNGGYYSKYVNYYNAEIDENCQILYQSSAKCEKKLNSKYKQYNDSNGCDYMSKTLPALEKVYKSGKASGGGKVAAAFAWLFFFSTVGACAGLYYFYTKAKRSTLGLSSGLPVGIAA